MPDDNTESNPDVLGNINIDADEATEKKGTATGDDTTAGAAAADADGGGTVDDTTAGAGTEDKVDGAEGTEATEQSVVDSPALETNEPKQPDDELATLRKRAADLEAENSRLKTSTASQADETKQKAQRDADVAEEKFWNDYNSISSKIETGETDFVSLTPTEQATLARGTVKLHQEMLDLKRNQGAREQSQRAEAEANQFWNSFSSDVKNKDVAGVARKLWDECSAKAMQGVDTNDPAAVAYARGRASALWESRLDIERARAKAKTLSGKDKSNSPAAPAANKKGSTSVVPPNAAPRGGDRAVDDDDKDDRDFIAAARNSDPSDVLSFGH